MHGARLGGDTRSEHLLLRISPFHVTGTALGHLRPGDAVIPLARVLLIIPEDEAPEPRPGGDEQHRTERQGQAGQLEDCRPDGCRRTSAVPLPSGGGYRLLTGLAVGVLPRRLFGGDDRTAPESQLGQAKRRERDLRAVRREDRDQGLHQHPNTVPVQGRHPQRMDQRGEPVPGDDDTRDPGLRQVVLGLQPVHRADDREGIHDVHLRLQVPRPNGGGVQ